MLRMIHRLRTRPWFCGVALVALLSLVPAQIHALAMGPGLFMVQQVPPGEVVDLRAVGGPVFTIENDTDQDQDYNLTCRRPSESGLTEWEAGYEEIPDPAWFQLEETVFSIPARQSKQIGLRIAIPAGAHYHNRKFLLAVVLKAGKDPAFGVGLAIAARVQIETTISPDLPALHGDAIAVAPGTLTLTGHPGAPLTGTVQVRNDSGQPLTAQIERLPQVYPDTRKHGRYVSNGYQPNVLEAWLMPQPARQAVAVAAIVPVTFTGTIPRTAVPGQRYEEVAFIRTTTASGTAQLTLVRLHIHVTAAVDPAITPPPQP